MACISGVVSVPDRLKNTADTRSSSRARALQRVDGVGEGRRLAVVGDGRDLLQVLGEARSIAGGNARSSPCRTAASRTASSMFQQRVLARRRLGRFRLGFRRLGSARLLRCRWLGLGRLLRLAGHGSSPAGCAGAVLWTLSLALSRRTSCTSEPHAPTSSPRRRGPSDGPAWGVLRILMRPAEPWWRCDLGARLRGHDDMRARAFTTQRSARGFGQFQGLRGDEDPHPILLVERLLTAPRRVFGLGDPLKVTGHRGLSPPDGTRSPVSVGCVTSRAACSPPSP